VKFVPTAGFIATSFRTLPRFHVVRALTVADAVSALHNSEEPAVLAGGTDLPARFNEGFFPSDLIDVSHVDELRSANAVSSAANSFRRNRAGSGRPVRSRISKQPPSAMNACARARSGMSMRFMRALRSRSDLMLSYTCQRACPA
jgi:FAD binding domain in molybdopterin dehydrogenase